MRPWTTLAPEHSASVEIAHSKCQTHLVYLGHNMYGVLRPRPFVNVDAPLTLDEVLNPMLIRKSCNPMQQEPLNRSVVPPAVNEALDTGNMSAHTANEDTDVVMPDDPDVPEVGAETTVLSDSQEINNNFKSSDTEESSRAKLVRTAEFCRAVEDARDKHLKIKLVMLTNAELDYYLNVKPDNIDTKTDNDTFIPTGNSNPVPGTSKGNTVPRCAPVNYAESSASEGGTIHGDTSDSKWSAEETPIESKNAANHHGPSEARMAAQRLIQAAKSSTKTTPKLDTDQKSSSGSSRSHSPDSVKNDGKHPPPKSSLRSKRKGVLSIKTHGIKKIKKDRTLSCKECDYHSDCIKLLNEHHIDEHDPIPCAECDHVSSTPSSHARHLYKHKSRNQVYM